MFRSNRMVTKEDIEVLPQIDRYSLEAAITDARAVQIGDRYLETRPRTLAEYVAGQPWRGYAFGYLGDLRGRRVLDVGCGYSMTPVYMALAGAEVWAVDVSAEAIHLTNRFAAKRGVDNRLITMVGPAEALTVPDRFFDLAFGGAALHHLQLDPFATELRRVLRPGGRAVFQDPLGENPILEFIRDRVDYRNRHAAKGTDRPLTFAQVERFGRYFDYHEYHAFDALAMVAKGRVDKHHPIRGWLAAADRVMFRALPVTRRLARFVVTCVTR